MKNVFVYMDGTSLQPQAVLKRYIQEEKERCSEIDKRIEDLENQFYALVEERSVADKSRAELDVIAERISVNRDLRSILYSRRLSNT